MKKKEKVNIIYISADIADENLSALLEEQERCCHTILSMNACVEKVIVLTEIVTGDERLVLEKMRELMRSGYVNSVAVSDLALVGDSIQEIFSFVGLAVENKVKILIAKYPSETLEFNSAVDTLLKLIVS